MTTSELSASFTDSSTDDQAVVSRVWDFGDNTSSNSVNPIHVYNAEGTYYVTLTVMDAEGLTSVSTQQVTVNESTNTGCSGIETWTATAVYLTGDEVALNGVKYKANWWTQGQNPAESGDWGPWTASGTCN